MDEYNNDQSFPFPSQMVRPPKSSEPSKKQKKTNLPANPEKFQRNLLKSLAISSGILSVDPEGSESWLGPSRTVLKNDDGDIVKKSQRKNRFLFAFPGLIGPSGGGRIGELKDLGTKNPILYLEFPQGRMKLFGTIVYPKNRYLTLQFPKGGKNVMCEDYFDAMIVFSDAWWIGKKEENPEEARLEFPKEFTEGQHAEHDFTGGAGASVQNKSSSFKRTIKTDTKLIHEVEQEGDSSDAEANMTEVVQVTPVRHSARTAGNSIKYRETSSGSKSIKSDSDEVNTEKEKDQAESAFSTFVEAHNGDNPHKIEQDCNHTASADKPNKQSMSSRTKLKDTPTTNCDYLVQARISTMFKKAEDKNTSRIKKKSELTTITASGQKPRGSCSTRKVNEISISSRMPMEATKAGSVDVSEIGLRLSGMGHQVNAPSYTVHIGQAPVLVNLTSWRSSLDVESPGVQDCNWEPDIYSWMGQKA